MRDYAMYSLYQSQPEIKVVSMRRPCFTQLIVSPTNASPSNRGEGGLGEAGGAAGVRTDRQEGK